MILRFRIFDDGIGFRYEVPRQNQLSEFTILDELTEFNLSEDSPSWWIPAYAYRRYEFLYAKTLISEISRDKFSELVENLNGPRIGPEAVQTPFTTQKRWHGCDHTRSKPGQLFQYGTKSYGYKEFRV